MPRGGKREGAGRKPQLTPEQRIAIGVEYEKRRRAEEAQTLEVAWAKLLDGSFYREATKRVVSGLRSFGPDWLSSEEGQDALDDVEAARRHMARKVPEYRDDYEECADWDAEAPHVFTVRGRRTYGRTSAREREVALWASEKFGLNVSPRAVRQCWEVTSAVINSD